MEESAIDEESTLEDILVISGGVESYFEDDVFPPEVLDTVLMYRISTDTWHQLNRRMPRPRTDHTMLAHQVLGLNE